MGKDRRLWRRRLSEFLSESKVLGGRPSCVPKAEARKSRAEALGAGARPAGASSGPQGSKKQRRKEATRLQLFLLTARTGSCLAGG